MIQIKPKKRKRRLPSKVLRLAMTNKYLIVGPAWIGDMVMSQTLYKLIKRSVPDAVIDVLAPKHTAPLVDRMPEVRQFIPLPIGHGAFNLSTRVTIAKQIKTMQYDNAIVLPNSWKSAIIPFIARIPRRTGWVGEMRWGLLNDARLLNKQQLPLMIQRFAKLYTKNKEALPKQLPWPAFQVDQKKRQQTLSKFQISFQEKNRILALCPGAEYGPAKRWPVTHYAAVANKKLDQGWTIWIIGSAKEKVIATEIQALTQSRCHDFSGETQLDEVIDLLSMANAVVTNDSGLMHIAAALSIPLVAIYGSTDPRFTPPLSKVVTIERLNLSCSPCFKRECPLGHLACLTQLTPESVLSALNAL